MIHHEFSYLPKSLSRKIELATDLDELKKAVLEALVSIDNCLSNFQPGDSSYDLDTYYQTKMKKKKPHLLIWLSLKIYIKHFLN